MRADTGSSRAKESRYYTSMEYGLGIDQPMVYKNMETSLSHWADSLVVTLPEGGLAHDLCALFGSGTDSLAIRLERNSYAGTALQSSFTGPNKVEANEVLGHLSFSLGAWIPSGALGIIGPRPEFGVRFGAKHRRMNYDLSIASRFGPSSHSYVARHKHGDGTIDTTSHFLGAHIGADIGWDLIPRKKHFEVQLIGGIGWDGFDTFKNDEDHKDQDATASSLDISTGTEFRWYFKRGGYVGLQAAYHWVDYSRNGVVSLTGQPFSLRFIVGYLSFRRLSFGQQNWNGRDLY